MLVTFAPSLQKLGSSERRDSQLRKCLQNINLSQICGAFSWLMWEDSALCGLCQILEDSSYWFLTISILHSQAFKRAQPPPFSLPHRYPRCSRSRGGDPASRWVSQIHFSHSDFHRYCSVTVRDRSVFNPCRSLKQNSLPGTEASLIVFESHTCFTSRGGLWSA